MNTADTPPRSLTVLRLYSIYSFVHSICCPTSEMERDKVTLRTEGLWIRLELNRESWKRAEEAFTQKWVK